MLCSRVTLFAVTLIPAALLAQTTPSVPAGCVVNPDSVFGSTSLVRTLTLTSDLDALSENPPVPNRPAPGLATITVRLERTSTASDVPTRAVVSANLSVTPAQAESVTSAHIHTGLPGVNGTIVFALNPEAPFEVAAGATGRINKEIVVTDPAMLTSLAGILANPAAFYVNIHSSAFPGGFTRGQLRVASSDANGCLLNDSQLIRRLVILLAADRGLISAAERDQLLGSGAN